MGAIVQAEEDTVTGPDRRRGDRRPAVVRLAARAGLTVRGLWAVTAAIGAVFVAAAGSYAVLFPDPSPGGAALVLAVVAGIVGLPTLVAGLCGVGSDRGRPFTEEGLR